jgi:hypothetical protein
MIHRGELSWDERTRQAEAFVGWYHRAPTGEWRDRFAWWADSKDLHPVDRWAIASIVGRTMLAGGSTVVTDPFEFLEAEGDAA